LRKVVGLSLVKPSNSVIKKHYQVDENIMAKIISGKKPLPFKYTYILPTIGILNCELDNYQLLKSILTGGEAPSNPIADEFMTYLVEDLGLKQSKENFGLPLKSREFSAFVEGEYTIYSLGRKAIPAGEFPGDSFIGKKNDIYLSWNKMTKALSMMKNEVTQKEGIAAIKQIFNSDVQNEASVTSLLSYCYINLKGLLKDSLSVEQVAYLIEGNLKLIQDPLLLNFSRQLKEGEKESLECITTDNVFVLDEIKGVSIFKNPESLVNFIKSFSSTSYFNPFHTLFFYKRAINKDLKSFDLDRDKLKAFYLQQGLFTIHRLFCALDEIPYHSEEFDSPNF